VETVEFLSRTDRAKGAQKDEGPGFVGDDSKLAGDLVVEGIDEYRQFYSLIEPLKSISGWSSGDCPPH
jgi:hypothetical protein